MSVKPTSDGQVRLIGVSLRPENGEKILLLHFDDHSFNSLILKKGTTLKDVSWDVREFADQIVFQLGDKNGN